MKKIFGILLVAILLLSSAFSEETVRVYDSAELFSEQEKEQIEERIRQFRTENKIDFAVLTTDDFIAKDDNQDIIAAIFYQSMDLGIGKNKDGAVFYIDDNHGRGLVLPQGELLVNEIMTTMDDIHYIINECNPFFSEGKFAEGVLHGIDVLQNMIDAYWEKEMN